MPNWLKERRVTLPNALDPTEIHAVVRGPELSPYARGFFTVKLFIEAEFPRLPPRVVFSTRVFHPNVCEVTGDVCKIALRRMWCSEDWDLERFLNGLVDLMERPFLDKPLNMTAARLFSAERDGFDRRARLCTVLHALPRSLTPVKRRRTSSSTTSDYCGFADLDPLVGNACYEDVADDLVPMAPLPHVGLSLDPMEATEVLSCSNSDSPSTPCAMSVDGDSEPVEAPRGRVPLEIVVDDDYGSSSSDDSEDGRDIVVDGMTTPQRGCGRCSPSAEPRSTGKLANTPKGGLFEHGISITSFQSMFVDESAALESLDRYLAVRKTVADSGCDCLVLVCGPDGSLNSGSVQCALHLLYGTSGRELIESEFSDMADELSELFMIVSGKEGSWSTIFCQDAVVSKVSAMTRLWPSTLVFSADMDKDIDTYDSQKTAAFIRALSGTTRIAVCPSLLGEKVNITRLNMSVEKWPLVKAYGYEGFATSGFLTLSNDVTDISERLNREVLSKWTPAAVTHATQGHCMRELEAAWDDSITAVTRMAECEKISGKEIGKPIIELNDYGELGDDGIAPEEMKLTAGCWFGAEAMSLSGRRSEDCGVVGRLRARRDCYMVWRGVHPETRVTCARTYLLPSRTTAVDDVEEIESMTMEAIRLVRDAAVAVSSGLDAPCTDSEVKVVCIDALGSTSKTRPGRAETACAFISALVASKDVTVMYGDTYMFGASGEAVAVTRDRIPQLTPLAWGCSRSQVEAHRAVKADASRFLLKHKGVQMGRLLLKMSSEATGDEEVSMGEAGPTHNLGELQFAPPDATCRSRIGLWRLHATERSILARVGVSQAKMSIYSRGLAFTSGGSGALLVEINEESSLCLIEGTKTGGPWVTMTPNSRHILVFELTRPSLQSTGDDDYQPSPSRVLQHWRDRGIIIGVKNINNLPPEVTRFLRDEKTPQLSVNEQLLRRFTLPCAEVMSLEGVLFVAGLPGSEASTHRLAKNLAAHLGAECQQLRYGPTANECFEKDGMAGRLVIWTTCIEDSLAYLITLTSKIDFVGLIVALLDPETYFPVRRDRELRNPLVGRLVRLCKAIAMPGPGSASEAERAIQTDLKRICSGVPLIACGTERPVDIINELKESRSMSRLYPARERASLLATKPQSVVLIKLELPATGAGAALSRARLSRLCRHLGAGHEGRYLDPEYRWPLSVGAILLSAEVWGVLADDDEPADALLQRVRAKTWAHWSYPVSDDHPVSGTSPPSIKGRFLVTRRSSSISSGLGKEFTALVLQECLPEIPPHKAPLTESVVPADVREALLKDIERRELPNGWLFDGTFYIDLNSGQRTRIHPELSARLAFYVSARQSEVDEHNAAVAALKSAAIVH
ncbi:ubiquitin-conjugating enzyme E2 S [Perkinsus olseni]|uniref:Ubiquitin-conjugating enzyme E2 S n=1 Tax=Perkinsus olseni TaxID=32597 RepID=A0A7J6M7F5_PEROL|nr:ubiquitin-conjugating enzyme E2 S [Perkinsus olseni]